MNIFDSFSIGQVLIDGLLLTSVMGAVIIASLYANPRVWLQDFPKQIRAVLPPINAEEKRLQMAFGVLLLGGMIAAMLYAVMGLRAEHGDALTFGHALLHLYLVFQIFNLFDALVIDTLLIIVWHPKWVMVPGVEGLEHYYANFAFQAEGFVKGAVGGLIFVLPFALLAVL